MSNIADSKISELIRSTRPLFPTDSVERAVTIMRASGGGAAPVISGMQVVGIVREADLLPAIAASSNGHGVDSENLPAVSTVMRPASAFIHPACTFEEATNAFTSTGAEVLPVVNEYGIYSGYLVRSDVAAALSNALRPAMVGGLATPIGVHLTCGSQRGGVGDGALILLGVFFGLLNIAGFAIAGIVYWAAQRWLGQPLYAALKSTPIGTLNPYDMAVYIAGVMPIVSVLLGIRFLPIAGYHAGEHQTVHAIEQGEPLEYEAVRRMPRVHPRCGTNIAAAASIFIVLISVFPGPLIVFGAIIVVLLGWRSIGGWLQYYVTTRPASRRQIESGIKAGKELLANYRAEVIGEREPGRRIWNVGFVQIGIGLVLTLLAAQEATIMLHLHLPFLQ